MAARILIRCIYSDGYRVATCMNEGDTIKDLKLRLDAELLRRDSLLSSSVILVQIDNSLHKVLSFLLADSFLEQETCTLRHEKRVFTIRDSSHGFGFEFPIDMDVKLIPLSSSFNNDQSTGFVIAILNESKARIPRHGDFAQNFKSLFIFHQCRKYRSLLLARSSCVVRLLQDESQCSRRKYLIFKFQSLFILAVFL